MAFGLSPRLIALLSYLLVAGGILLQMFIILSGYITTTPIGKTYFLAADTSNIPNAPEQARWTFLAICGDAGNPNGRNANCRSTQAALPFDPPRNFDTTQNVPSQFLDTHYFYYMSRFAFAFYLIALFFAVCTLVSGLLAICFTRIGSFISILFVGTAWFFQALAAVLMTVWSVKGRNRFRSNGQSAKIGQSGYGFTWGAFACFFLCLVLYAAAGLTGRRKAAGMKRSESVRSREGGAFAAGAEDPDRSSFDRHRV